MFNLEYIAANVGSEIAKAGDVFVTESVKASGGVLTLKNAPVAVSPNGHAKLFYRPANDPDAKMKAVDIDGKTYTLGEEEDKEGDYCVLYRYTDDAAEQVTVNAQFIPDTLHAVLTVALYAGDSCNVEAATKVGEVEIDIPRFQLTGAMDISMTATGASQTSLEGNALASGCVGCDGDGVYATITKVIFGAHWYDNATGIIVEDSHIEVSAAEGDLNRTLNVYAVYDNGAPKLVPNADLTFAVTAGTTNIAVGAHTGIVTSSSIARGTATIKVTCTVKPELKAGATIIVAD